MRPLLLLFALVFASPALAQNAPVRIDPGMTRAQVIELLGQPATERSSNGFTYLFYINGCERTCGMNDLITLRGDSVTDAIFRAPHREFTGRSSSPVQNRTPRANRGPLTVRPDSVVMRIIPADSASSPPPGTGGLVAPARTQDTIQAGGAAPRPLPPGVTPQDQRPFGDLTGRTIVPGARPESLRSTRLPADPPPQTGATVNPPVLRPDTTRNTPGTRPDTTRGERLPVTRSDTVMNPRTPTVIPRADTTARPPAGRPVTPPPSPAQPPAAAPLSP